MFTPMHLILSGICIFVVSCASMQMKPYTNVKRSYIETTTLTKANAFEGSLVWLAKNIKDSNYAIKVKDAEMGRVVAKISYPCKGLKRPDVIISVGTTDVDMDVDISIKDKKIKYEFEMTGFVKDLGAYGKQHLFIPDDTGQAEAVESCFNSLKSDLLLALSKSTDKSW